MREGNIFRINLSDTGRGVVTIIKIEKETLKIIKFKKRLFISQVKKCDLDRVIGTAFKSQRAIFTLDESRIEEHKKSLVDLMISINKKRELTTANNLKSLNDLQWIIKE